MLDILTDLNQWIKDHLELVTAVGVPILTLLITFLTNTASAKRSSKERALERELRSKDLLIERELSRKMKLAEFRQDWINHLRDDLAEIASLTVNPAALEGQRIHELNKRTGRVRLRLNLTEPLSKKLLLAMNAASEQSKQDDEGELQTALVNAGQELLKFEWDRLKSDLAEIEKIQDQAWNV